VLGAVRPRKGGGLVLGVERGFALLDPGDDEPRTLPPLWTDPSVRMNDGACDARGRFYCGSMAYDETPGRGRLYRLDPDGSTDVVLDGVTISNGLAWTPDGSLAYYVDTPTQRVDVLTVDPRGGGDFVDRRPLVTVPYEHGAPDGLTLDADGGIWVALFGGRAVHRYTADGRLDAVVDVPASQVTACAFGGPELSDLYVTTSREGVDPSDEPAAGALFWCRPGVRGVDVHVFAG
jgi:sugar lactone lactonase YvrE